MSSINFLKVLNEIKECISKQGLNGLSIDQIIANFPKYNKFLVSKAVPYLLKCKEFHIHVNVSNTEASSSSSSDSEFDLDKNFDNESSEIIIPSSFNLLVYLNIKSYPEKLLNDSTQSRVLVALANSGILGSTLQEMNDCFKCQSPHNLVDKFCGFNLISKKTVSPSNESKGNRFKNRSILLQLNRFSHYFNFECVEPNQDFFFELCKWIRHIMIISSRITLRFSELRKFFGLSRNNFTSLKHKISELQIVDIYIECENDDCLTWSVSLSSNISKNESIIGLCGFRNQCSSYDHIAAFINVSSAGISLKGLTSYFGIQSKRAQRIVRELIQDFDYKTDSVIEGKNVIQRIVSDLESSVNFTFEILAKSNELMIDDSIPCNADFDIKIWRKERIQNILLQHEGLVSLSQLSSKLRDDYSIAFNTKSIIDSKTIRRALADLSEELNISQLDLTDLFVQIPPLPIVVAKTCSEERYRNYKIDLFVNYVSKRHLYPVDIKSSISNANKSINSLSFFKMISEISKFKVPLQSEQFFYNFLGLQFSKININQIANNITLRSLLNIFCVSDDTAASICLDNIDKDSSRKGAFFNLMFTAYISNIEFNQFIKSAFYIDDQMAESLLHYFQDKFVNSVFILMYLGLLKTDILTVSHPLAEISVLLSSVVITAENPLIGLTFDIIESRQSLVEIWSSQKYNNECEVNLHEDNKLVLSLCGKKLSDLNSLIMKDMENMEWKDLKKSPSLTIKSLCSIYSKKPSDANESRTKNISISTVQTRPKKLNYRKRKIAEITTDADILENSRPELLVENALSIVSGPVDDKMNSNEIIDGNWSYDQDASLFESTLFMHLSNCLDLPKPLSHVSSQFLPLESDVLTMLICSNIKYNLKLIKSCLYKQSEYRRRLKDYLEQISSFREALSCIISKDLFDSSSTVISFLNKILAVWPENKLHTSLDFPVEHQTAIQFFIEDDFVKKLNYLREMNNIDSLVNVASHLWKLGCLTTLETESSNTASYLMGVKLSNAYFSNLGGEIQNIVYEALLEFQDSNSNLSLLEILLKYFQKRPQLTTYCGSYAALFSMPLDALSFFYLRIDSDNHSKRVESLDNNILEINKLSETNLSSVCLNRVTGVLYWKTESDLNFPLNIEQESTLTSKQNNKALKEIEQSDSRFVLPGTILDKNRRRYNMAKSSQIESSFTKTISTDSESVFCPWNFGSRINKELLCHFESSVLAYLSKFPYSKIDEIHKVVFMLSLDQTYTLLRLMEDKCIIVSLETVNASIQNPFTKTIYCTDELLFSIR